MKKSIYIIITTIILIFSFTIPSLCAKNAEYPTFTEDQNKTIDQLSDAILNAYGIDAYFVFDASVSGSDATVNLAKNTYNAKSKNTNGVCLSITKDYYYFYTVGSAKSALNDEDQEKIYNEMKAHTDSIYNYTIAYYSSLNTQLANYNFTKNYVVDNAELLDSTEKAYLEKKLTEISTRQNFDVVVVTTNSLDGKTAEAYADDYYDYNGYGKGNNNDGCLLLVSMEDRDWHITTTGYGITALTDAGIEYISDQFLPDLSDGNYYNSFAIYANKVDEFVTQAKNGQPYDIGNLPKQAKEFGIRTIAIGVAFGVVVALLVVGYFKSQLKSVASKKEASEYLVQESFVVTGAYDNFIRSDIIRTAKAEKSSSGGSSTHSSSSGTSHGGGGGKF